MIPSQHVFSHQHQYQTEPSWLHQQQQHHQQQHPNHLAQQHAQTQAAAAAAAVAQQNHYNRIAVNNNTNGSAIHSDNPMGNGADGNWSEENRRVLGWVAELLNGNSRETALMELSKKREQVPELALIIWHSFGMIEEHAVYRECRLTRASRCHDIPSSRDNISLPATQPFSAHSSCFKSCL